MSLTSRKYFGGDAEIDAQGRVLMPAELREGLELEKQPVWLDCYNGRINVAGKRDSRGAHAARHGEYGREGEDAREEGIEVAVMYARSGHVARVPGVSGAQAGRRVSGRDRGMGGHTGAIARQLDERVWCWPATGMRRVWSWPSEYRGVCASRIRFHQSFVFSRWERRWRQRGFTQLDGLLADLGVSRYQLTEGGRGFSLMADGPLDMRMDRSQGQTAADIVNYESEKELADLIFRLGEERRSRRIARAIVRARPIKTTGQLAKLIERSCPAREKFIPRRRHSWRCASR